MNNPQEIIVYNGPADYYMWQAVEQGYVFIAICAAIAFIAAFLMTQKVRESLAARARRWNINPAPSFMVATVAALAVIYLMV